MLCMWRVCKCVFDAYVNAVCDVYVNVVWVWRVCKCCVCVTCSRPPWRPVQRPRTVCGQCQVHVTGGRSLQVSGGTLRGQQPLSGPQEAWREVCLYSGVCAERGVRGGRRRHGVRVPSRLLQHRQRLWEAEEARRCVRRLRRVRGERRLHDGDRRGVRLQAGLLQQHGGPVPAEDPPRPALHAPGHVRRERRLLRRHGRRVRVSAGLLHRQRPMRAQKTRRRDVPRQRPVHPAQRMRQTDTWLPVHWELLREEREVLEG